MKKGRDLQVNVESTEISFTEEQELGELEVNVRKQQDPQVNEESTEVSFTEEQELGECGKAAKTGSNRRDHAGCRHWWP